MRDVFFRGEAIDAEVTNPHTYFHQTAEELRSSYELAYYPTNAAKDGSFRKIVIRAKREGLKVRSKTGYFSREARESLGLMKIDRYRFPAKAKSKAPRAKPARGAPKIHFNHQYLGHPPTISIEALRRLIPLYKACCILTIGSPAS
jgi:hypothetical protein